MSDRTLMLGGSSESELGKKLTFVGENHTGKTIMSVQVRRTASGRADLVIEHTEYKLSFKTNSERAFTRLICESLEPEAAAALAALIGGGK